MNFKKILALLLAVCMVMGTAPVEVNAFVMPFSMQPLDEVEAKCDLTTYNRYELKDMPIKTIFEKSIDKATNNPIVVTGSATKVVVRENKDRYGSSSDSQYKVYDINGKIDISEYFYRWGDEKQELKLEFLVGDGNQLNTENKRYLIDIKANKGIYFFDLDVYKKENGAMVKIPDNLNREPWYYDEEESRYKYNKNIDVSDAKKDIFVELGLKANYTGNLKCYTLKKDNWKEYNNLDDLAKLQSAIQAGKVVDISADIMGGKYQVKGSEKYKNLRLYLVYEKNGKEYFNKLAIYLNTKGVDWLQGRIYTNDGWRQLNRTGNRDNIMFNYYYDSDVKDMVQLYDYDLNFNEILDYLDMAVVGDYDSLVSAKSQVDIKSELFATSGYKYDFLKSPVISIFVKGKKDPIKVRFIKSIGDPRLKLSDQVNAESLIRERGDKTLIYTIPKEVVDYKNKDYFLLFPYADLMEDVSIDGKDIKSEISNRGIYKLKYFEEIKLYVKLKNGEVKERILKTRLAEDVKIDINAKPQWHSRTDFEVNGLYNVYSNKIYTIPNEHESYYNMGYQTLLVCDENIDVSNLKPTFSNYGSSTVYAADKNNAGIKQESGQSVVDFKDRTVQYAVSGKDGTSLRNYWVSVVKKHTGGAKLFVNGPKEREVFLTSYQNNKHDVFIANIGDQPLTGLSVELKDAKNIKLDDYWKVGGAKNDTLAAFDTAEKDSSKKSDMVELSNVAKIRLLPTDTDGEISGKLIIKADGQETVEINLTGNAGEPEFLTTDLPSGVKYVPYGVQLLQNNKYDWIKVEFRQTSGEMPDGISLSKNGEIYGVPQEVKKSNVRIEMVLKVEGNTKNSGKNFDLNILENTNDNVANQTDKGYKLETSVGTEQGSNNYILNTVSENKVFKSEGELPEFVDFWLNGKKLAKGTDYQAESGSTKITIMSKTFKALPQNKANTISAEFRVGGKRNNELKKTAQNFTIKIGGSNGSTPSESGSGTGGSTPSGSDSGSGSPSPSLNVSGGGDVGAPSQTSSNNEASKDDTANKPVEKYDVVKKLEPVVEELMLEPTSVVEESDTTMVNPEAFAETITKLNSRMGDKDGLIKLGLSDADKDLKELEVGIPADVLAKMKENPNVDLEVSAGDIASVKVPNEVVAAVEDSKDIFVKLARKGDSLELAIEVDGAELSSFAKAVKVKIPKLADGEVIVLLKTDGSEEVVKKSVLKDGTVMAELKGSGTIVVRNLSKNFSDISEDAWFNDFAKALSSRGILKGTGDDTFSPNMPLSRAMIATMLYRLEDASTSVASTPFADINADMWYTDSVSWMANKGLMSGYEDGSFDPDKSLTREELASVLFRYAKTIGLDTEVRGDVSGYTDFSDASAWAKDALRWAVGMNIFEGYDGMLNPDADIKRSEAAKVFCKLIEAIVE